MNYLVNKEEYTKALQNLISPLLYQGLKSIYDNSCNAIKDGEEKKLLKIFQDFLKKIPTWNNDIINNETKRITVMCNCDFIENLLKAVIKANIVLLSNSSKVKKEFLDIDFKVFIHKCYIECGKLSYKYPYLFYHGVSPIEKRKNERDIHELIKTAIEETIRKMLPLKYILNSYLEGGYTETSYTKDDSIDSVISEKTKTDLKTRVNYDLNINDFSYNVDSKYKSKNNFTDSIQYLNINKSKKFSEKMKSRSKSNKSNIEKSVKKSNIEKSVKKSIIENQSLTENKIQEKLSLKLKEKESRIPETTEVNGSLSETDNYIKLPIRKKFEAKIDDIINEDTEVYQLENDTEYEGVFSNIKNK